MDISKVVSFLQSRNVADTSYITFLKSLPKAFTPKLCSAEGYDFMLEGFFDNTDSEYLNLVNANKRLFEHDDQYVAIGWAEGDDVICFHTHTGGIYLWLTDESSTPCFLHIADSFDEFINGAIANIGF